MRSVAVIVFGFSLIVTVASLGTLFPIHPWVPNLLLPIAVYMGVSAEVSSVRGAMVCFVLGYLLDAFSGSSVGLQTFVLVASFFAARGAGVRFAPQGPFFQILMNFVMAMATGGTIVALRAIFDRPPPFTTHGTTQNSMMLLQSATSTALLSPFVFAGMRRIDSWWTRRSEERPV